MKKSFVIIFLCIILLGVGLSYTYFTGRVESNPKDLLVTSKNVKILFADSEEPVDNDIKPGWSQTKTFSVNNESDDTFNYNIVFENLVNTFTTEGLLQYKITSSNGYNMDGYLDIPKSNTPTDVVLAYDIDLPKDIEHEYTIEFIYNNNETVDQSNDTGKIFEGNLAIVEGSANPDIKYTVTMNSDKGSISSISNQAIKYENLEFEVTPNTGYDINSMSVSCTPVANTVITGNKIRVNDIRQDHNCEVSFNKETYTVDIVVNNGESNALNKVVEYGEDASAKITPNKGYTLVDATTEGPCTIKGEVLSISNVVSNGICTVTLSREKYTVTLTGTGIEISNSPQEAEYEGSTDITFTLSEGYELGENVINCDNAEPSISGNTLTVSSVLDNTTCTLTPTLKSYEVTLVVNGGLPSTLVKIVEHNGSNTYQIINGAGYKLELDGSITCTGNATGSLSGSEVTISNVTTTQTCTVNLKKETRTVNITKTGSGTVSPSSTTVNYGDDLTVSVTSSTGYKYSSNDCGLTVTDNKMTFENITEDKSCTVSFTKLTYTVNASSNNTSYGTVSVDKSTVEYGGTAKITITPKSGYVYSSDNCGGTRSENIITISNIKENKSCTVTFIKVSLLVDAIHTAYGTPTSGRTNFSVIDNGTPKLYKGSDDQGTTYYFSGDGSQMNNWVKFANKWWRIIRINGNNGVRLLYAGDGNNANDIGKSAFSSSINHPAYVGWKYTVGGTLAKDRGNSTLSTMYTFINNNWYSKLSSTDKNYVDTNAIYCNDRNMGSEWPYSTTASFNYAGYTRLSSNQTPKFTCNAKDQFKDGFGLMTADEIVAAGGLYATNSPKAYYYLAKDGATSITSSAWWTMTPLGFYYSSSDIHARMFMVNGGGSLPGYLSLNSVGSASFIVRPVVSLKSNILVSGSGSTSDPYVVQGLQ